MTLFASRDTWTSRRLNAVCRKRGVSLSERNGDVIFHGQVVGSFELAGGTLVLHDIDESSPLIGIFDLQRLD